MFKGFVLTLIIRYIMILCILFDDIIVNVYIEFILVIYLRHTGIQNFSRCLEELKF